jgi:NAD(P)H-nitrite reductase large subunit
MLMDGDQGVVIQRDFATYAITPHLPCGLVSPDQLRAIADVAEQFGATLKCTSAQRIAIVGLREQDIDAAWAKIGGSPAYMTGNVIRSVRACPGIEFCKRARQDSLAMGLALDRRYYGRKLPGKMKIGVSGCGNQCCDTAIRDIGLVGGSRGWHILVGGSGGLTPRLAKELTDREVSTDEALDLVDKILRFYETTARDGERLGDTLSRVKMDALKEAVGLA